MVVGRISNPAWTEYHSVLDLNGAFRTALALAQVRQSSFLADVANFSHLIRPAEPSIRSHANLSAPILKDVQPVYLALPVHCEYVEKGRLHLFGRTKRL